MPPRVKVASWPEDAPSRFDENVISISAGNSNLNWALHSNSNSGFTPILFWRTPPVLRDEQQNQDACAVLARHLPRQVHGIIFGAHDADHHKDIAARVAAQRKAPALAVYVCSTNHEHENGIDFLFKDVPSRVRRLQNFHFFSPEDGAYETIGVDRVATLYSCKQSYPDRHVMCMDAGTAWTYTALDNKGKILGGGIAPGVGARFRCMADYCDGLPEIDHKDYHNALKEQVRKKEPFPIFAKDTQTAMLSTTFTEISNQARYLVKQFLEKAKEDDGGVRPTDRDSKPLVLVCGGDAPFLIKVLSEEFSDIVKQEVDNIFPFETFEVEECKHLVHYGVAQLLMRNMIPESTDPDEQLREAIQGNRVAKRFASTSSYDGTDIFRGSVMSIKRGPRLEEDLFFVRYDDGDSEHLEFSDVYDALQLYLEVGESADNDVLRVEHINKAVNLMESANKTLKEDASKRKEQRSEEMEKQKQTKKDREQAQSAQPAGKRGRKMKEGGPQAKKKAKTTDQATDKRTMYLNKRIAKLFDVDGGQEVFFGTIDRLATPKEPFLWHVIYDDEDDEEFDEKDVIEGLKRYQLYRHDDTEYQGQQAVSVVDGLQQGEPTTEGGEDVAES